VYSWDLEESYSSPLIDMLISVLHHVIAPEVVVNNINDLGKICVIPFGVAKNTLRMIRLFKSSKSIDSKLSDRRRVILTSILHTIALKNEIPNGQKYFERIFKFGSDRGTLGKNRIDFYVNTVAGCSDQTLQQYFELLYDQNALLNAKKEIAKLSTRLKEPKVSKWES